MAITNQIDEGLFLDQLMVLLRQNVTDPEGRGTNFSQDFPTNGVTTTFDLTYKNVKKINSASLVVGGTTYNEFFEYTCDYDVSSANQGRLTFPVAPAGVDTLRVDYDYDETWVYASEPKTDVEYSNYPRIAVMSNPGVTEEYSLGAIADKTALSYSIVILDTSKRRLMGLLKQVRKAIQENKQYYNEIKFVRLTDKSSVETDIVRNNKIHQVTQDIELPFQIEIIT